jgi:hypothetical protein
MEKAEYQAKLNDLDDDALAKEAERQIWLSAFAGNNPRAPAHWKADEIYDEAERRGKPWLYQRGYNEAYASCGYEPSDEDIEAAKAPAS